MNESTPYGRSRASRTASSGFLLALLLVVGFLVLMPASAAEVGDTFVVNSTGDDLDSEYGDGICATATGSCTLRAAITESNYHTGPNAVAFAIPGDGVNTIKLSQQLPPLKDRTGPTTIDGYTQPGSSPNSDPRASNAKITIQIEGGGPELFGGLAIESAGNIVRGLAFYELREKIRIQGIDAHDNRIVGNFLGTDASGTYRDVAHVSGGYASGVRLINGASNNLIGGASTADRNVISGNASQGVGLYDAGTDQNVIEGNVVGLTPSGGGSLANLGVGVDINYGASRNVVGGTLQGERNVISGNVREGVEISHHSSTFPTGNRVIGNFVGTDFTGQSAPRYAHNGGSENLDAVHLVDGATDSVVANNVIGNANQSGVGIDGTDGNDGSQTTGNRVYANRIGVSRSGAPIPNGVAGVMIYAGARGSIIGPDNRIANNPVGVRVIGSDTRSNTITSNRIYQDAGLGIDLDPYGPTPNDPKDADFGPNSLQNKPAIGSALTSGGTTSIRGILNTTPSEAFVVRFFSNPRGTSEGKTFIGRRAVTTGADGKASFTFRTASAVRPGRTVTATATATSGDTSEFSVARTVKRP